jgi:hypothetical protein
LLSGSSFVILNGICLYAQLEYKSIFQTVIFINIRTFIKSSFT